MPAEDSGATAPKASPQPHPDAATMTAPAPQLPQPNVREVPVPSGMVLEMRHMRTKDLDLFLDKMLNKSGKVLHSVLDSCFVKVVDPGPYTLRQGEKPNWGVMAQQDVTAVLIHVRRLGLGDAASFDMACQNFMCGETIEWDLDLGVLPYRPMAAAAVESIRSGMPIEFKFPMEGVSCKWHVMTGQDAIAVALPLRGEGKREVFLNTMVQVVDEIEGMAANDKRRWLQDLGVGDHNAFQMEVNELEGGHDSDFEIKCQECGNEQTVSLPMSSDFFSGETPRKQRARHSSKKSPGSSSATKALDSQG